MLSLVIPVYKNEEGLKDLFLALKDLSRECDSRFKQNLEVVFVVDGSPDNSYEIIRGEMNSFEFKAQLVAHSRNFGSFAAIRTGLQVSNGDHFAVMAADLQEPPSLVLDIYTSLLTGMVDVAVGTRISREDPLFSRISSGLFWKAYKKYVITEIPEGGVDMFGCNKPFKDQLLALNESHSSLVGLIYWLGFRRLEIPYNRLSRKHGRSAWSFKGKIKYMLDSLFAFTDLPIRILIGFGLLGLLVSVGFAASVTILRLLDIITVPGYAATVTAITFFGGLNSLGIGIVGNYTWRAYENSKQRPLSIVRSSENNY